MCDSQKCFPDKDKVTKSGEKINKNNNKKYAR